MTDKILKAMTLKGKAAAGRKSPAATYAFVIAAYAVLELFIRTGVMSSHLQGLLVPMVYYAIVAVGLNICVGILGELSLGHAGFMCIGAFGSAVFSLLTDGVLPDGLRFLFAFLVGVALSTLFGFLIGIPVLRLNGDYLAIVTLAFGEIIKNLLNALYLGIDENGLHASLSNQMALGLSPDGKMLINGAMGVTGTPHDANFTISVVVLLIALFFAQNLVHSKHGRAIMAIKMQAFTISAAIAGAAGVLFSHNISTLQATSQNFGYNVSIMILVYVVLGGIGNLRGSVIAASVLYLLPELLRGLNKYRMLIYSIVLIAVMIFNWAPAAITWRENLAAKIRAGRHGRKENA